MLSGDRYLKLDDIKGGDDSSGGSFEMPPEFDPKAEYKSSESNESGEDGHSWFQQMFKSYESVFPAAFKNSPKNARKNK